MGERRSAYRILMEKLEGKRSRSKHRRRGEDNIKMDIQDKG
jgi:hypothetical protein